MKKIIFTFIILISVAHAKANPNFVITTGMHMDMDGNLIQPDRLFMAEALKAHNKGFNQSAFNYFLKAAALGNSLSQRYIALMYINGLGVEKDITTGYAWIRLAAKDGTSKTKIMKQQTLALLTPEQLKQSEILYEQVNEEFGSIAALTRRHRWVRKQKMKMTGTRTGSLAFAPLSFDSPHGNGFYNQAKSYVDDYNFGYISSGEIIPIESSTEGN